MNTAVENTTAEFHVIELTLPVTLPANAFGTEMIRVIEDHSVLDEEGYSKVHVALAFDANDAKGWGAYLADIVHVVARDYDFDFGDDVGRNDDEIFATILKGFNERVMELKKAEGGSDE